jgi:hypothetical protein
VTRKGFEAPIQELATGKATLQRTAGAMLTARAPLETGYGRCAVRLTPEKHARYSTNLIPM